MRYRKLRIAWSALCGVACYLLSAFWAMSYLPGGRIHTVGMAGGVYRPYGCAIIVVAVLGIMPWTSWRFGLRTLLIATTLVALVLGLIMWLRRSPLHSVLASAVGAVILSFVRPATNRDPGRTEPENLSMTHSGMRCSVILCLLLIAAKSFGAINEITEPFQGIRLVHSVSTVPRLVDMFVVEIDMSSPGLSLLVSPSNGALSGDATPQTTRDFVSQVGAQIGINGAFYNFAANGQLDALGLSASNGDIYSQFEPGWPDALNISASNVATIIRGVGRGGVAHTPDVPLYNAISGNTQLVVGGVNVASTTNTAIHPRTAVGVKPDGKLLLFTVDGRIPSHSNGLTYVEMANILLRWGVRDAINLDGGTSTTLVMDNPSTPANDAAVINVPSDGFESAVVNNLAVFAKPQTAPSESRVVFADFEQGDEGSFGSSPIAAGAIANLSSAEAVSGQAFEGQWSQRLTIVDDPSTSDDENNPGAAWFVRELSGMGDPASNVSRPSLGALGLWAKTSNPDLRISLAIDESGGSASERGVPQSMIADGQWHPYFWVLTDPSQWEGLNNGDGNITGAFTLDSIQVFGPPESGGNRDAVVYFDSISHIIPGQVPEPASSVTVILTLAIAFSIRRR